MVERRVFSTEYGGEEGAGHVDGGGLLVGLGVLLGEFADLRATEARGGDGSGGLDEVVLAQDFGDFSALRTGAVVHPNGAKFAGEGGLELIAQGAGGGEVGDAVAELGVEVNGGVLLGRSREGDDLVKGSALLLELGEEEIESVEPHEGGGGVFFLGVGDASGLGLVSGEGGCEVDGGFVRDLLSSRVVEDSGDTLRGAIDSEDE